MDAASARSALSDKGYVVDIGQLDASARAHLSKEVRAGRLRRIRAPLYGLLLAKTHYVADERMFVDAQRTSAESLRAAARMDAALRAAVRTPGPKPERTSNRQVKQ